jgi:exodeoxyribonuclease V alpha subunit
MQTKECQVRFIKYTNPETGRAIFETKLEGQTEFVSCFCPNIRVGAMLEVEGEFEYNKWGKTFKANRVTELVKTQESVFNLLNSGMIKGIGPALAERIAKRFGGDTIKIMDEHIEQLLVVPGVGPSSLARIQDSWKMQREAGATLVFLQDMGLEGPLALRIIKKYGKQTKSVIDSDPYCLCSVWGCSFALVDTIAKEQGIELADERRIEAGIKQVLVNSESEGHMFLPFEDLKAGTIKLLDVDGAEIRRIVIKMIKDGMLVNDGVDVYLPRNIASEKSIAEQLSRLNVKPMRLDDAVNVEEILGLKLDETQKQAVRYMRENSICILTGGPGTGKTTIVKGMLATLEGSGLSVALAAPTGRASKRMAELTGHWAKTIHRLLRYTPTGGFSFNEANKLKYDAVIVDETSMVDSSLMDCLLKALPTGTRLVLVGDSDQLPSVGAGNVLHDLMESGLFATTKLDTIHRQARESRIVVNAHKANHGEALLSSGGDFWYLPCAEQDIAKTVEGLVKKRLVDYAKCPSEEIQVLSPTRRLCADINALLQQKEGEKVGDFRVGDKVIQQVNNYEKGVFNGDIGKLTKYDRITGLATIDFDGQEVEYTISDLDEVELAYAVTVHKSQGSEYPVVVVTLTPSDRGMLQRNLLYTALTRAKNLLVVVGSWESVEKCVQNDKRAQRNSNLTRRLKEVFQKNAE